MISEVFLSKPAFENVANMESKAGLIVTIKLVINLVL